MLVLDHLAFAHAGHAEYRFSMQVAPGEIVAVAGPSGSGKSTLLDLIAGFLTPTSGELTLDGVSLLGLAPEARPVSILFQSELLFEHLTATQNVALGMPGGIERKTAAAQVAAALDELGLEGIGEQRGSTLSGGQKQRVALARTLLRARPVLLLDEPFSALDDQTRGEMRALVARLTTTRRWHTVMVSHNAEDISALGARLYRLSNNRLLG
jgi:thiamine transport system ATP-binding protein